MLKAKVGDGSDVGQKAPLLSHWLTGGPAVTSPVFGANSSSVEACTGLSTLQLVSMTQCV